MNRIKLYVPKSQAPAKRQGGTWRLSKSGRGYNVYNPTAKLIYDLYYKNGLRVFLNGQEIEFLDLLADRETFTEFITPDKRVADALRIKYINESRISIAPAPGYMSGSFCYIDLPAGTTVADLKYDGSRMSARVNGKVFKIYVPLSQVGKSLPRC